MDGASEISAVHRQMRRHKPHYEEYYCVVIFYPSDYQPRLGLVPVDNGIMQAKSIDDLCIWYWLLEHNRVRRNLFVWNPCSSRKSCVKPGDLAEGCCFGTMVVIKYILETGEPVDMAKEDIESVLTAYRDIIDKP
ncbi:hypothetical protein BJ138DRAFT_1105811 [Hygrophoropsis aurantiaca]|uniref:Uncharacterized protein n=1 Tax=Hygrophoropsis aurantiaca TaxID=72124 RepID=A0ACB7ZX69_9AGAM|nr:hypothetical protein BJ138DRAFT_1105811 [Hygrophoropsis aurantiaca]